MNMRVGANGDAKVTESTRKNDKSKRWNRGTKVWRDRGIEVEWYGDIEMRRQNEMGTWRDKGTETQRNRKTVE